MTIPPTALMTMLRRHCPEWATGHGGRGLLQRHLETLRTVPELRPIFLHAVHWRWQLAPWDPAASGLCQHLELSLPPCPQALPKESAAQFTEAMRAIAAGDADCARALWFDHGHRAGSAIWMGETGLFFLRRGERQTIQRIVENPGIPETHPASLIVRALQTFCFDPPDLATTVLTALPEAWLELKTYLHAELLLRHDDPSGPATLTALWRRMPWHTNLTLKLHSLLKPRAAAALPGKNTAALVYSWNNAELLHKTLHSLAASNLGEATLFVLDNGSSDHTAQIISGMVPRLGARLRHFSLPVNIGAPAARNWLFMHPELSAFQTIAFVDDDVLLPATWLTELLAAHDTRAVIVGCRIMDQQPRTSVQMADINLLDLDGDGEFQIANAGSGELDMGLHQYSRPCLSVTGCCHLMHRERLLELGGFDLRFGPSQFDDFDLDLRNLLHGGHAIYAGRTSIRHCQRSSLGQADSEAKQGHIHGNMLKLNTKYTPEQKAQLIQRHRDLLWDDLIAKTTDLENL
jgi:GT2 family glycosyltransferase